MTLCQCGCGEIAPIAKWSDKRTGLVKGQPARFVKGHFNFAERRGQSNPGWVGEAPSYNTIHRYLQRNHPKTGVCDECSDETRTEYALIHGRTHGRDRSNYRELCPPCHNEYDAHLRTGRPRKPVGA